MLAAAGVWTGRLLQQMGVSCELLMQWMGQHIGRFVAVSCVVYAIC
jgi:hypothetical protein